MPLFSRASQSRLDTCEGRLIVLFERVILHRDCSILCGVRSREAQEEAFASGASTKHWPKSRHNVLTVDGMSEAVDVSPYPIDWDDTHRFEVFAAYVLGVAEGLDIPIRWGGAWNGTRNKPGQFEDLVHYELLE